MLKCQYSISFNFQNLPKKITISFIKVALHDQLRQRNDRNWNLRGVRKLFPYEYNSYAFCCCCSIMVIYDICSFHDAFFSQFNQECPV